VNETYVTVCGTVGTDPRRVVGDEWVITSFRLAHTPRRFDRRQGGWTDGDTSWYGVKASRSLANHVAVSVSKGDRVVVHGRLRVSEWRTSEGELRSGFVIEADTVGHDLTFGTSTFSRARADRPEVSGSALADQMLQQAEDEARRIRSADGSTPEGDALADDLDDEADDRPDDADEPGDADGPGDADEPGDAYSGLVLESAGRG
jgi:single-strand DNA-binding protein